MTVAPSEMTASAAIAMLPTRAHAAHDRFPRSPLIAAFAPAFTQTHGVPTVRALVWRVPMEKSATRDCGPRTRLHAKSAVRMHPHPHRRKARGEILRSFEDSASAPGLARRLQ